MNNRKMNLDRPKLNSEQIQARQNFEEVLSKQMLSKPPIWKNPWFWGPTGLASIGVALLISANTNSQNETHDTKTTLTKTELPDDTPCIHPIQPNEDIPFEKFEVNPSKSEEINLKSGTKITIPKGSLLTENNATTVQISVREFSDKSSSFIAGIPMDYQKDAAFISAGMIEIRGTQEADVIRINTEKPIEIEMQLTKNPSGFLFWQLDENAKKWVDFPAKLTAQQEDDNRKANTLKPNPLKVEALNNQLIAIENTIQETRKPLVENYKIPAENHQQFDLEFNKKTYPELAKFENLVFEIIPTTGYDKSFTKKTWSDVKLEKSKENYEIIFTASTEKLRLPVRPVLQGKELQVAKNEFDHAIENYTSTIENLTKNKAELEKRRAAYLSSFEKELSFSENVNTTNKSQGTATFTINEWGVYNCDKPSKYPNALVNEPFFVWKNTATSLELNQLVVLNLDKDLRFTYGNGSSHALSTFGLHLNDELVIVGIDREGNIGVCELKNVQSKADFARIFFEKITKDENLKKKLATLMNETTSV